MLSMHLVKRAWRANIFRGIAANASKRGEGALLGTIETDQFITIKIIRFCFSLSQTLSVFIFDVLRTSNFSGFPMENLRAWAKSLNNLTSNRGARLMLAGLSGAVVACCWYLLGKGLDLVALPILFAMTFALQQLTAPILAFLYQTRNNPVLNWLACLSLTYFTVGFGTIYLKPHVSSIHVAGVLFGGALASHIYLALALWLGRHRN